MPDRGPPTIDPATIVRHLKIIAERFAEVDPATFKIPVAILGEVTRMQHQLIAATMIGDAEDATGAFWFLLHHLGGFCLLAALPKVSIEQKQEPSP